MPLMKVHRMLCELLLGKLLLCELLLCELVLSELLLGKIHVVHVLHRNVLHHKMRLCREVRIDVSGKGVGINRCMSSPIKRKILRCVRRHWLRHHREGIICCSAESRNLLDRLRSFRCWQNPISEERSSLGNIARTPVTCIAITCVSRVGSEFAKVPCCRIRKPGVAGTRNRDKQPEDKEPENKEEEKGAPRAACHYRHERWQGTIPFSDGVHTLTD